MTLASVFNNAIGANADQFINTRANIVANAGFLATNVTSLRFDFRSNLTEGYAG